MSKKKILIGIAVGALAAIVIYTAATMDYAKLFGEEGSAVEQTK